MNHYLYIMTWKEVAVEYLCEEVTTWGDVKIFDDRMTNNSSLILSVQFKYRVY